MSIPKPPVSAWVVSATLALVTLFVFGVLQDYGPEATIRRFHQAALEGNSREVAYLSHRPSAIRGTGVTTSTVMAEAVRGLMGSDVRLQLYAVSRRSNRAAAVVTYLNARRQMEVALIWIVVRSDGVWRIDTDATVQVNPGLAANFSVGR
jgi:hypothetical protein